MQDTPLTAAKSAIYGQRATFGLSLASYATLYPALHVFTADTLSSAGLSRFASKYPSQLTDCSITEQAMLCTASGYALSSGCSVAVTFAPFVAMRAYEQIRHCLGYMNAPVLVTGIASGISLSELGYTHCCIEDIGLMSNVSGIQIWSPIDSYTVQLIVYQYLSSPTPTYLRLTGVPGEKPLQYNHTIQSNLDYIPLVSSGSDYVILSTGAITSEVQDAVLRLQNESLSLTLLGVNRIDTLHPDILQLCDNSKHVFVVDESLSTGLYSLFLKHKLSIPSTFIGHPDVYPKVGSYSFMKSKLGLDSDGIYSTIKRTLDSMPPTP